MKNINFEHFSKLNEIYEPNDNYFLNKQASYFERHKPLKSLKILHNIPLTLETLKKVETLLKSEVKLTVTSLSFIPPVPEAVEILQNAGVEVIVDHKSIKDDFDIVLDCSAEFRHFKPRLGSVELTKTGVNLYNDAKLSYPVIDIDSTRTKEIETVLGTGDGFIRAFLELTKLEDLKGKNIVVFGYGKVGQGIARRVIEKNGKVSVIEVDSDRLELARSHGHSTVNGKETSKVETMVQSSFSVVTATGINGIISKQYNPQIFIGKILANMGGGDEFGGDIPEVAALANKAPINFSIEKPTLMKYIDPIFYLHNHSAELLAQYKLKDGVHILNKAKDIQVSDDWENFHKESI